jgi:hypothetical protein
LISWWASPLALNERCGDEWSKVETVVQSSTT